MQQLYTLFFILVLWSSQLSAQPAQPPEQDKQRTLLLAEAEAHYNLLEFESALALYQQAYLASRDPELLFSFGQCYEQLNQPDKARNSYERYLELNPQGPRASELRALLAKKAEPLSPEPNNTPTAKTAELPADTPTRSSAPLLYKGALASSALGLFAGTLALSVKLQATRSLVDDDPQAFLEKTARAKQLGLASDGLLLLGVLGGVAAQRLAPSPYVAPTLFGAAAASLLAGSVMGGVAFSADKKAARLSPSDPGEARFQDERATIFSRSADLMFLGSALFGGAGLFVYLGHEKLSLSPASKGVAFLLRF